MGEDLFGKTGTWNVAFPLAKVEGKIRKFTPEYKHNKRTSVCINSR